MAHLFLSMFCVTAWMLLDARNVYRGLWQYQITELHLKAHPRRTVRDFCKQTKKTDKHLGFKCLMSVQVRKGHAWVDVCEPFSQLSHYRQRYYRIRLKCFAHTFRSTIQMMSQNKQIFSDVL